MTSSVVLLKALIGIFLVISVLAQQNYQQRAIYLGKNDNVCNHGGPRMDRINLMIMVGDFEKIEVLADGATYCHEFMLDPEKAIKPAASWSWLGLDGTELFFKEETQYVTYLGDLLQIVQKTTLDPDPTLVSKFKGA